MALVSRLTGWAVRGALVVPGGLWARSWANQLRRRGGQMCCQRGLAAWAVSADGRKVILGPCSCAKAYSNQAPDSTKSVQLFKKAAANSPRNLQALFACFVGLFLASALDWKQLEQKHGIKIPFLLSWMIPNSSKKDNMEAKLASGSERTSSDKGGKSATLLEILLEYASVKAKEVEAIDHHNDDGESECEEATEDLSLSEGKKSSGNVGFRNRKIIEYENRIRQYSTPDKIFRYFATYRVMDEKGHSEVMMTPEDFVRSITPGMKQPEQLGLDQFTSIGVDDVASLSVGVEESSIFYQLGAGGLISFSDYIFLLTVLSTSRRHFEIAFKMFDLNGDGNVDAKEFEVVTNLMKSQSSMGARHRDHNNTGSTFKGINSGLITYFFGEQKEGILTVDKFLEFQRQLQNEILALEFKRKLPAVANTLGSILKPEERISEKDFAELLIAYAGFPSKKRAKMLKRVRKEFCSDKSDLKENPGQGIAIADYLNFYQVLYSINDIDTALTFYHIAGAPIERETMKHVAKTVAGVDLSDHVINVVFVLFDENGDGKLSNKEFVSVMKQRAMRGLEKPKDTGIGKIFAAVTKCAGDTRPTILGGLRKTE